MDITLGKIVEVSESLIGVGWVRLHGNPVDCWRFSIVVAFPTILSVVGSGAVVGIVVEFVGSEVA